MDEWESWKAGEAAAYLRVVRKSLLEQQRLIDEIEVERSLMPGIDYSRERVKSSPRHDSLERSVIKLEELEVRHAEQLEECVELRAEAVAAIDRLEDVRYKTMLTLYYVDGHSWETVAEKARYNVQYCKDLRAEALPLFWEVMPRSAKTRIPRAD